MALIRNKNHVKQLLNFEGVGDKSYHPTDVDAVMEYKNESLILFEVKKIGYKLPIGQKLLLERLVDCWPTDQAISIVVKHNVPDDSTEVMLKDTWVRQYYFKGKWYYCNKPLMPYLKKIKTKWKIDKLNI